MKKILVIATVYRCGEKMYPIIPHLCKENEVDVLMFNQMSCNTPWYGDRDPRFQFYEDCKKWGANVIQGPSHKEVNNNFRKGKAMSRHVNEKKYDLIILDDNKVKAGWGTPSLCQHMRSLGNKVIGSPHGNTEFDLYGLDNKINDILDYSFVFGNKEKTELIKGKNNSRLIPAGIPSNDYLKNYSRGNKYILVFVSYVQGNNAQKKNKNGYEPFTEDTFLNSGLLEIQRREGLPIIIKEKSRFKEGLEYSLKHLEKYDGVSVIMDHESNDKLIAGSKFVVAAPSTLAFKSIQMGIPTVLLKNFGMTGNFDDFDGLSNLDSLSVQKKLYNQVENGRCSDFIDDTLSGGLNFNSTEIHLKSIQEILDGRTEF